MNIKSNFLFRILILMVTISALLHLGNIRLYFEIEGLSKVLYLSNALIISIYIAIAFNLARIRKSYQRASFFTETDINRFKKIGFLLLAIVPINGLVETISHISSHPTSLEPSKLLLNFVSYSTFKSPSFLLCALIIFILLDYFPKAEKSRTELKGII